VSRWITDLRNHLRNHPRVVRVAVLKARGSTPREAGAVMLVTPHDIDGTIGGGELEWRAEKLARSMFLPDLGPLKIERWPLGPELGQCCGGSVTLWFERFEQSDLPFLTGLAARLERGEQGWLLSRDRGGLVERQWTYQPPVEGDGESLVESLGRADPPVWVFGAGHVGRALVGLLETLPFSVSVIDSRASALEALPKGRSLRRLSDDPAAMVNQAPSGAALLVMTHSHEIDYGICRAALQRSDLAWVGLIGSDTKATCFRLRLSRDGLDDARIATLVSPIGVEGVRSKLPAAIAVAVAAQLLQRVRSRDS